MHPQILLIDDDPIAHLISRRVISRSFSEEIIKEFLSASEALEYIKKLSRPDNIRFIIFLDINMPGLSGWDFLKLIKENFPSLDYRVYLLTSSVNESDKEKARTYDAIEEFIEKPFSFGKLQALELQEEIFPGR